MISPATLADVQMMAAIELGCFGSAAWSEALLRGVVEGERHTVLVDDLDAYGAISITGDVADLDRLAVMPTSRRRGIARRLLDALLEEARGQGVARVMLEVAADNAAAIGLYESCGFGPISRRSGYYPGGVDALVMQLEIEESP